MTININNLNNTTKSAQVNQKVEQQVQLKQQSTNSTANAEQAKRVGQDSVSLTPQAQKLSELQKKASDAPVIDQKKIAQIRKAIASGEYRIDPDKLAASIAGFEFKLP